MRFLLQTQRLLTVPQVFSLTKTSNDIVLKLIQSLSLNKASGVPLLFNIFRNDLRIAIERSQFMNYADDTEIYTADPKPQVVEEDINRDCKRQYVRCMIT